MSSAIGRDVPEDVDGQEGPGPVADRGLRRRPGHALGLGVDLAEHRCRSACTDALRGGEEREVRNDDLVARPDAKRPQRDRERVGAVGHGDAVAAPDVVRELGLERLDLWTEQVAA